VLKVLLHLLDETIPFIRVVSSFIRSLLSPNDNESGEQILIVEKLIWHEVFTFCDHFQLCLVDKEQFPLHAALVALTDDGYDEVHEYYVADNQNEQPEEPGEDLEFFRAVYDCRGVGVTDSLTQYNHEICKRFDSIVGLSRFNHYDIGHDSQGSNHNKEEEEKNT
jgi:hypothetical protein